MLNEIKKALNTTTTANGDIAYATTFNANLDFFGLAGAARDVQANVEHLFREAYHEDTTLALKNLFYLRDIRNGIGERTSFRTCLKVLIERITLTSYENKAAFISLLNKIVKYGRYDDLLVFLDDQKTECIVSQFIYETLMHDLNTLKINPEAKISLCAKWAPSINASAKETRSYALKIIKHNPINHADYRKLLVTLRKHLDILETHLTNCDYTFAYENLPGKALQSHVEAFRRKDETRFTNYINSLSTHNVAKVATLYPHEILRLSHKERALAEAEWQALRRRFQGANTIVVRDGSGSMAGLPICVATSLAILYSEQLTGEFKDHFITFSARPELVSLGTCHSLAEKINECYRYNEHSNTDLTKVYDLIYNVSLNIQDPKDYVKQIVIISDMEFDQGVDHIPTYETFKNKFEAANLPLPQVIFWNVAARSIHFPTCLEPNIKLVSGFSKNIIDNLLNNGDLEDPIKFMHKTLETYVVNDILGCLEDFK